MEAEYATLVTDPYCLTVWLLWQKIATRFNFDAHCVGQAFDRLTQELSREDYDLMSQGIAILYDAFCPARTETD